VSNGVGSRIALASGVGAVSIGNLAAVIGVATDVIVACTALLGAVLSLGALVSEALQARPKPKPVGEPAIGSPLVPADPFPERESEDEP
jgi:hypothetical protein